MCIRNKLITFFFILLLLDLGIVLFCEDRAERKLVKTQSTYSGTLLQDNPLISMILGGGIHSNFILQKNYPVMYNQDALQSVLHIVKQFRNQVIAVFGLSLIAGFITSIIVTKRVSRPIVLLSNLSKMLWRGLPDSTLTKEMKIPSCRPVEALAESFKKMQKGLTEYEEEKSRLESVEITKNLAAGIAHEIKNPINTVGLIVDYIQTHFSPDDPEKRYEFFKLSDNMKNELRRINRTVEGFLRLTKPNVFQFEKIDLNGVIRDTASLFDPEIVKQGVTIHLELDPDLPLIKADKDKMNQIFSNFIINALEAMPRGGVFQITTAKFEQEKIEVRVADNGIGVPQEDLSKIFSPYYTTKKQGFGLGLSLIHSIIHGHKGRISINTERKKGTEFVIILPVDF